MQPFQMIAQTKPKPNFDLSFLDVPEQDNFA